MIHLAFGLRKITTDSRTGMRPYCRICWGVLPFSLVTRILSPSNPCLSAIIRIRRSTGTATPPTGSFQREMRNDRLASPLGTARSTPCLNPRNILQLRGDFRIVTVRQGHTLNNRIYFFKAAVGEALKTKFNVRPNVVVAI